MYEVKEGRHSIAVYDSKAHYLYKSAEERFEHQPEEFIGLFKRIFAQLCVEDGIIESEREFIRPPTHLRIM